MQGNFFRFKVTVIQFSTLIRWFFRDVHDWEHLQRLHLQYKFFSCGNKKDENSKYDQNCKTFEGGQNESAQGSRLRNTQIDKNN